MVWTFIIGVCRIAWRVTQNYAKPFIFKFYLFQLSLFAVVYIRIGTIDFPSLKTPILLNSITFSNRMSQIRNSLNQSNLQLPWKYFPYQFQKRHFLLQQHKVWSRQMSRICLRTISNFTSPFEPQYIHSDSVARFHWISDFKCLLVSYISRESMFNLSLT